MRHLQFRWKSNETVTDRERWARYIEFNVRIKDLLKDRQTRFQGEIFTVEGETSLTFAISVTIFPLWILYEDISTTQGSAPLCASVYVTKVTQVSVHVRETRCPFVNETRRVEKKHKRAGKFSKRQRNVLTICKQVSRTATCARLFKRTSDTQVYLCRVCTYACVCVRIVHILSGQI